MFEQMYFGTLFRIRIQYLIDLRREFFFVTDAPCKVEIEIQREWKQKIKIKI